MRDIPSPDAVLFDLDGTLADSLADIAWALDEALGGLGHARVAPEQVRGWVGDGARRLAARSLGTEDENDARVEPLLVRFRELYDANSGKRTQLYPGVVDLLDELERRGVPLACTTNKPLGATEPLLREMGIAARFGAVVAPEVVGGARKPDPAFFGRALELLGGIAPERALVVGDGLPDVEGAIAARIPVAAVLSGYGDPDVLRRAGADWYLRSTGDLLRRLLPPLGDAAPLALVVEDTRDILRMVRSLLETDGMRVIAAASPRDALLALGGRDPDLLVVDGELPGMHGSDLFTLLAARFPGLAARTLVVTGLADMPSIRAVRESHGVEVLEKPFRTDALLGACRRLARRR